MTFASIPILRNEPDLFARIAAPLLSRQYDPRDIPLNAGKHSMMVGMGMTEKQGGSDVRSNRTRAHAIGPGGAGGRGGEYRLDRPQVVLLRAAVRRASGASVHRRRRQSIVLLRAALHARRPQRTQWQVQRLKDKLGNRSNASSEVEFLDAYGVMIGDEGRGGPTIIEMANTTRLDCVIGSAALMRAARRSAADAQRARRSRARVRSRDAAVHVSRGRVRAERHSERGAAGTRVAAHREAYGEGLGLQRALQFTGEARGETGRVYGTLPAKFDYAAIMKRAFGA